MKLPSAPVCIAIAFLGSAAAADAALPSLLTFDSLPAGGPLTVDPPTVPNGYGGLNWNNFAVVDGLEFSPQYGYYTGVVSPDNVAFNDFGDPASISISGGLFDLDSGYLTAALNLNAPMQIEVQGFRGATLLYDNTYTVNNFGPTLFNFDYTGVNQVTFTSLASQQFAMDNLAVTVPEPGAAVLLILGAGYTFLRLRAAGLRTERARAS